MVHSPVLDSPPVTSGNALRPGLGDLFPAWTEPESGLVLIEVRARSDRDVYLAYEEDKGYLVFSTFPGDDISIGDILAHHHWNTRKGPWLTVWNVTRDMPFVVYLKNRQMSLKSACSLLGRVGVPGQITTIE